MHLYLQTTLQLSGILGSRPLHFQLKPFYIVSKETTAYLVFWQVSKGCCMIWLLPHYFFLSFFVAREQNNTRISCVKYFYKFLYSYPSCIFYNRNSSHPSWLILQCQSFFQLNSQFSSNTTLPPLSFLELTIWY